MSKRDAKQIAQPQTGRFPARFVSAAQLAEFLGMKTNTIHRLHWKGAVGVEGPPRTANRKYDTWNPEFQAWLDKFLGWKGAGAVSAFRREGARQAENGGCESRRTETPSAKQATLPPVTQPQMHFVEQPLLSSQQKQGLRLTNQNPKVEQRGKRFSIRYRERDITGQWSAPKRHTLLATTRKQAEAEAAKFMLAINQQNNHPTKKPESKYTYADFVGDITKPPAARRSLWQSYLDSRKVEPTTQSTYDFLCKHLLSQIGHLPVMRITPEKITEVLDYVRTHLTGTTIKMAYNLLTLQFRILSDHEKVEKSPVRKTIHLVKVEVRKKPALSAEQFKRLLEVIDDRLKLPVLIMGVTGLRQGECFGLKWRDFDGTYLTIQGIVVKRRWKEGAKTESSLRPILLPAAIAVMLATHKAVTSFHQPDDFIFSDADGRPLNYERLRFTLFYPALRAVGMEIQPYACGYHLLRHTAGRLGYELTRDLKSVQMMLAHSRIATTADIYVNHSQPEIPAQVSRRIYGQLNSVQ